MQKGQSLIIILVGILIIAGVVGGAYYLGKSSTSKSSPGPVVTSPASTQRGEQTPQPSPSPDETVYTEADRSANWKTYTNTKGGYSIKYPDDYIVSVDNDLVYDGIPVVSINPTVPTFPPLNYSISIAVQKNSENLSLSQPGKLFGIGPLIQYEKLSPNWNIRQTFLGGLPAVRVDHCCGGQYGIELEIKTIKDNMIYEVVITPDYDPATTKPDDEFYKNLRDLNKKKVYENIISTFKFLE